MSTKRDRFDRGSKWLIAQHGGSLLHLGAVGPVRAWRAVQPEVVQPRHLPDGLLEVYLQRRRSADYFLVEIATYPELRLLTQVQRGLSLVYLDRGVLPEVLTVVLRPKGRLTISGAHRLQSRLGWTQWQTNWRVVELWTLAAADLLATGDVGLIPWVPLTHFNAPPEAILQECRDRIDQQASGEEHANLLAVTQVMSQLRYNDLDLFEILGGSQAMIESPLIGRIRTQEIVKTMQKNILRFLKSRFGSVPDEIAARVHTIKSERRLNALIDQSGKCKSLSAFEANLKD